jgi:hypothetical protein
MFALLLAAAFAATQAETFQAAWELANSAAGTPEFAEMYELAAGKCTARLDRETGCSVQVAELKVTDRRQREYEAAKARTEAPAAPARVSAPIEFDEEEIAIPVARPPATARPVVYVDYDNGLGLVGGYSDPGGSWTGLRLHDWDNLVSGPAVVCVMKDGAPIPMGEEVLVSFSKQQGSGFFLCPAARIYGDQPLFVPEGATVHIAVPSNERTGVWVVARSKRCEKYTNARVDTRSVSSCLGG